jgi:hypothetical protein
MDGMKFATPRPFSDPEAAARKLIEIANSVEAVQDGRIHIELLNGPMLFEHKATPAEYGAGLKLAIERGWLVMHELCEIYPGWCGAIRMTTCAYCEDCGWVCENHPDNLWMATTPAAVAPPECPARNAIRATWTTAATAGRHAYPIRQEGIPPLAAGPHASIIRSFSRMVENSSP